ncbi:MAG: PrsW family intramembrane metalloprotease [Bacteroidales bacterium]|nr:PrsW family intramembrane metalloprotease [Bacteroidales bacterium]
MQLVIIRNNQQFGPYDEVSLLTYVNNGQILLCDKAKDLNGTENTVEYFLKKSHQKYKVKSRGNIFSQLKDIGTELILPRDAFKRKHWVADKKLLMLALVGLLPLCIGFVLQGWLMFYAVSLYFAAIWGMFFYYLFKTPQVSKRHTMIVFFSTQIFVFIVWDILTLPNINPFYNLIDSSFPLTLLGFILGIGLTEECAKLLPVYVVSRKAKEPLIPQTLVFYGLISGIAFGVFEGVQYQIEVNSQLEYDSSFLMNIARLTSLPFLHAMWCGIAGYFVSFAKLYPKYRYGLWFLAIIVPATLHGLYDTFCNTFIGLLIAIPVMMISVALLMTYLKQGVNYQSKLSK